MTVSMSPPNIAELRESAGMHSRVPRHGNYHLDHCMECQYYSRRCDDDEVSRGEPEMPPVIMSAEDELLG
jgi:NAD-dependent SIR2 family protein deacetylase